MFDQYRPYELKWKLGDALADLREIRDRLEQGELESEDPEWWRECERQCLQKIAELEAELRRRGLDV